MKVHSIVNLLLLGFVLWWNYYTNSGAMNGETAGSISRAVENQFTPAAYAFSIWGIIYFALSLKAVYLVLEAFRNQGKAEQFRFLFPWFYFTHFCNVLWLFAWLTYSFTASILVMIAFLTTLLILVQQIKRIEKTKVGQLPKIIKLPVELYAAWISVATVANIAAYLQYNNWSAWGISEEIWSGLMMLILLLLNILIIKREKLFIFPTVAIWALVAIGVRQLQLSFELASWAFGLTAVLGVYSVFAFIKKSQVSE